MRRPPSPEDDKSTTRATRIQHPDHNGLLILIAFPYGEASVNARTADLNAETLRWIREVELGQVAPALDHVIVLDGNGQVRPAVRGRQKP
jgi:hypothetical protein